MILQDLDDARFITVLQKLVEKSSLAVNVVTLLNKILHYQYSNYSASKTIQIQDLLKGNFWPDTIKTFGELYQNIIKEVVIAIKVRKQVTSYLAKHLLATYSTGSIGDYSCLFMQTQFQLGSCIHAGTNETHSPTGLQDLITSLASLSCL